MSNEQPIQQSDGTILYSCIKCKTQHVYDAEICPQCQTPVPLDIFKSRSDAAEIINKNMVESNARIGSLISKFARGGLVLGALFGIYLTFTMWMAEPTIIVYKGGLPDVIVNSSWVPEMSTRIIYSIFYLVLPTVFGPVAGAKLCKWLFANGLLK